MKLTRVKCSVAFFYDKESYLWDVDDKNIDDEEILNRCRDMFMEDITSQTEPFPARYVEAEFVEIKIGDNGIQEITSRV